MPSATSPARVQGSLRLAVAILVVGVLAVWLVKPIGNACPDLGRLPQGSSAKSSPSFSPPLTRTCTYTATIGVQARARYVPWLDWIVIVLIAALAGGVANLVSPAGRRARAGDEGAAAASARAPRPAREPREPGPSRAPRPAPAARQQSLQRERPARDAGAPGERDAAERERARRERAERPRRDR